MPENLEIARMSKELQLTGDKEVDAENVAAFIGAIDAKKIRKFPSGDSETDPG